MKHLTLRNIPSELAEALQQEKHRRRQSLNQTVLDLLRQSLGLATRSARSNGLAELAGNWSEEEFREFSQAIAPTEEIDEEMWR
ncbi:MAG: hypothetical protein HY319_11235 [Armatimonadetes bacterium]|nr:hypothetical protein [Armatimonadota bacterium]